jgi:hypothetical protein
MNARLNPINKILTINNFIFFFFFLINNRKDIIKEKEDRTQQGPHYT